MTQCIHVSSGLDYEALPGRASAQFQVARKIDGHIAMDFTLCSSAFCRSCFLVSHQHHPPLAFLVARRVPQRPAPPRGYSRPPPQSAHVTLSQWSYGLASPPPNWQGGQMPNTVLSAGPSPCLLSHGAGSACDLTSIPLYIREIIRAHVYHTPILE